MTDPLIGNYDDVNLSPEEIQNTLMGFLGQTYQEISRYDSNIVSPNAFLAPKKQEFQRLAEKVISETITTVAPPIHQAPTSPQRLNHKSLHQNSQAVPYIDSGKVPLAPPQGDPDQLEFSFDNSITAKSINKKLEDLEIRVKSVDNMLKKMLSLLEGYESKNKE